MNITITFTDAQAHALRWCKNRQNAGIFVPPGETLEAQPDYVADETAYVQYVMNQAANSYIKQMPKLTRRQAFAGLRAAGLLDTVQGFVAAAPADVRQEWEETDVFLRWNPMLNASWAAMNPGKTQAELDAQLDAMFEQFATY